MDASLRICAASRAAPQSFAASAFDHVVSDEAAARVAVQRFGADAADRRARTGGAAVLAPREHHAALEGALLSLRAHVGGTERDDPSPGGDHVLAHATGYEVHW